MPPLIENDGEDYRPSAEQTNIYIMPDCWCRMRFMIQCPIDRLPMNDQKSQFGIINNTSHCRENIIRAPQVACQMV